HIAPAPSSHVQQGAWIERMDLTSHFSQDGGGLHEATYTIRNAGLTALPLRLPSTVSEVRLVDDDGHEQVLMAATGGGLTPVPLVAGQRRSLVRIRFTSAASPPGLWPLGRFRVPLPQPVLPVLARQWQVEVPPGFAAAGDHHAELKSEKDARPISSSTWQGVRALFAGPALLAGRALATKSGLFPLGTSLTP